MRWMETSLARVLCCFIQDVDARPKPAIRLEESAKSTEVRLMIRIRGVAKAVAHEVEGEHDDHHRQDRKQQPGMQLYGGEVLRLVEQHSPAGHRRAQAEAEERQRRLAEDHRRN